VPRPPPYREGMRSILRPLRHLIAPLAAVVFVTLWAVAEAGRTHDALHVITLALFGVAIGISRVLPRTALIVVTSILLLQVFGVLPHPESTNWPVYFAVGIVAFVVALEGGARARRVALLLAVPVAITIAYLMAVPTATHPYGWASWTGGGYSSRPNVMAFVTIASVAAGLYVGAWALGFALRVNVLEAHARALLQKTSAKLDVAEVELVVTRERDHMAREVHDVLAHSLAVVLAQADGARFLSQTKPERADAAFRAIADAARAALIDVRTLVEGMREDQGEQPQPGISDIGPLLAQMAGAGMPVDHQDFGDPRPLTPAQQLAVFRIVQESLTNALRHADRSRPTRLSFDWRGPGLVLTVASGGSASARVRQEDATHTGDEAGGPVGAGHGIRGMKDRARLAGGWLTADREGEEFVVTGFVPTAGEAVAGLLELELAT